MKRIYNKNLFKKKVRKDREDREIQIMITNILIYRNIVLLKNNDIVVDDLNNWMTRRRLKKLSI